jgi:uncharacterized repeat protein (TIGR01451 family)
MSHRSLLRHAPAAFVAVSGALASAPAWGDPTLRYQGDLHGDVRVFGNTLAHDCASTVALPVGATASCTGQANIADTAPDLYWRDNIADATVAPAKARTSATLDLPSGSKVLWARLYWAALKDGQTADKNATLDWLGGPQTVITADASHTVQYPFASQPTWYFYQSSGNATQFVSTWLAGDFRVTDVEGIALAGQDVDVAFSAWSLVVVYENAADELRNIAVFDGLDKVDAEHGTPEKSVTLKGFLVPPGFSAKMAAIVYEGDFEYKGDYFAMNGTKAFNANNPIDNFFNSSRTFLGAAVSGAQDVPKLSGKPGSMSGYDLDMIDVTQLVKAGDTQAKVAAGSNNPNIALADKYYLGGFVTSITVKAPDFSDLTKTVTDVNGGAVLQGDVLEYTITTKNTGNDDAVGVVITDKLDPGLSFVSGSLEIVQGGKTGIKTDKAGDDEGEYDAGTSSVTVRAGIGATATTGGTVPAGSTVKVRFKAKVVAQSGTVANQAVLKAAGASGSPQKTYESDGDSSKLGRQTTDITIKECDNSSQCPPAKPYCDPNTNVCVGCKSDADCTDPLKPACQPSGACGQCSATNAKLCTGSTPVCNTSKGVCVLCTLGPSGNADQCKTSPDGPVCVAGPNDTVFCGCDQDSDCGNATSGRVCDTNVQKCIDGCRGKGGNGCPTALTCTSPDTTIGQCVTPGTDAGADGASDTGSGGGGGGGAGGGPATDGGVGGAAASGPAVGEVPAESKDEGGCACSAPGRRGLGAAGALLALTGVAVAGARRRSRLSRRP